MKIKLLGSGCEKEMKLRQNLESALQDLGLHDAEIEAIRDVSKISEYRISEFPALYVNNHLFTEGNALEKAEIIAKIKSMKKSTDIDKSDRTSALR